MKIEYQERGTESRLVITSSILGWKKHRYLVDTILLRVPHLQSAEDYQFIMKTVMSGGVADVLFAKVIVGRLGYQVAVISGVNNE